jgi:DNA-binding NarL/FixJ family response regulator
MVRPNPVPRAPLSARELHIARMIAAGASEREVATETQLSLRTIRARVEAICLKLGVESLQPFVDVLELRRP